MTYSKVQSEWSSFVGVVERALRMMRGHVVSVTPTEYPYYADGRWHSVGALLKKHEEYEKKEWTPERDSIAQLMAEGDERPSGISGIDPLYFRVKSYLVRIGREAMEKGRRR